jgi:hypothetical protein
MKWDVFFGPDNDDALRWTTLSVPGDQARAELQPFIDLVDQRAPIAALPRVRAGTKTVLWYVGWREDSDARMAQDLLRAFLGRTYAAMRDPIRPLQPSDLAEQAFADEFGGRAFRLEVGWHVRKGARKQLIRLANQLLERPIRLVPKVRPVGRVLRDLELALLAGDDTAATFEISTLRSGGHLDEANLAFLELRRLGAVEDWSQVLGHDALPSLLGFRSMPWRVRAVLLSAIFHQHIAESIGRGDVDVALLRLEPLLADFRVVFSSRRHLSGIHSTLCFLLADELRGTRAEDLTERALAEIEACGFRDFAQGFRKRIAPRQVPDLPVPALGIDDAQKALADSDLDRAYAIAVACVPSVKRARTLLQCARLLDEEVACFQALIACDELSESEQTALFAFNWCRSGYDELKRELGAPVRALTTDSGAAKVPTTSAPTVSWRGWFERLRAKTPWPGAVSRASSGATEWEIEAVASDADTLEEIVETLEASLEPWASDALHQAIPYLLDVFLCDPPDPRLASVVGSMFELLATDDALTLSSVSALVRLAHSRLTTSANGYSQLVETVVSAVEQASSPGTVRLVTETLELLATVPCRSIDDRHAAAIRLVSVANRWWNRVDSVDRALVRHLCEDLGLRDLLLPEPELALSGEGEGKNLSKALTGRVVALYSLTQSALERAASALKAACPGLRIKTFCEEVGTAPMKEAARTADLFVIATRSATHAATGVIMQHRNGPVEYARGKGSVTLIDAVRRWVQTGSHTVES